MGSERIESASYGFRLSSRTNWSRILGALQEEVPLTRVGPRREHCVFYDTFDQSLQQSNRWLARTDDELRLTQYSSRRFMDTELANPDNERGFAARLDRSILENRVVSSSRFRALCPTAESDDRVETYSHSVDGGKRFVLVEYRTIKPVEDGGTRTRLVSVSGDVRDEALVERLRSALARLGLLVLDNVFAYRAEKARTAFGAAAWRYLVTQEVAVVPDASVFDALQVIGEKALQAMEELRFGVEADLDPEFLHAYRVSMRRLRSLLKAASGGLAPVQATRLRSDLKRLGAVTNRLRDLDVLLMDSHSLGRGLPASLSIGVSELVEDLRKWRTEEHDKVKSLFCSRRYRSLLERWLALFDASSDSGLARGRRASESFRDCAARRIEKRMRKLGAEFSKLGKRPSDEDIHRVRVHCKDLRYLLWYARYALDVTAAEKLIKRMRKAQNALGRYNDGRMQLALFEEYLKRGDKSPESHTMAYASAGAILQALEERHERSRNSLFDEVAKLKSPKLLRYIDKLLA